MFYLFEGQPLQQLRGQLSQVFPLDLRSFPFAMELPWSYLRSGSLCIKMISFVLVIVFHQVNALLQSTNTLTLVFGCDSNHPPSNHLSLVSVQLVETWSYQHFNN